MLNRCTLFVDTDPGVGIMAGDAVITCAADESDISYYSLHVISSAGFLLDTIATVDVTGEATLVVPLVNLTLTKYAMGLAVVAGNATGRAGPAMAATVQIKDYCAMAALRRESFHGCATGSLVGKVPAVGFNRPQCEVDCHLLEMNVTSDEDGETYVFHRGAYDNNELAKILFSGPAVVTITSFRSGWRSWTEKYYDFLEVGGRPLSGTKLALPMKINLPSPSAVCRGHLLDFDSSHMVPSPALVAKDLRFIDENVQDTRQTQENFIKGRIEFYPPAMGAEAVTFYHVFFADSDGIAQWDQYTWTIDAPTTADEMLHIDAWALSDDGCGRFNRLMDIDMELPKSATDIVVVSGNGHGEGAQTKIPLKDIAAWRRPPLFANFTGDSDPVADQVRGDLVITPAAVTTGITSYAIYLGNGTKKEHGRAALIQGGTWLVAVQSVSGT
eukprot:Skav230703  [mRNA]  locus=scaffold1495:415815:435421:- [translate_table: standard]